MLVLERKIGQSIRLFVPASDKPQAIEVTLTEIKNRVARIGIEAAKEISIVRDNAKEQGPK